MKRKPGFLTVYFVDLVKRVVVDEPSDHVVLHVAHHGSFVGRVVEEMRLADRLLHHRFDLDAKLILIRQFGHII